MVRSEDLCLDIGLLWAGIMTGTVDISASRFCSPSGLPSTYNPPWPVGGVVVRPQDYLVAVIHLVSGVSSLRTRSLWGCLSWDWWCSTALTFGGFPPCLGPGSFVCPGSRYHSGGCIYIIFSPPSPSGSSSC